MLPLWVSAETLRLYADVVVSTGRAKATSLSPLKIIANLLPCPWIYDWAGRFTRGYGADGCDSEAIWSMKCLMRYKLAVSTPFTVRGKLHAAVQIIIPHHYSNHALLISYPTIDHIHILSIGLELACNGG